MAIAIDGTQTNTLVTATPINLSWTSGTGPNQLLVVAVCWDNRNAQTISSCTWNAQTMTSIGFVQSATANKAAVEVFILKDANIATSTAANVTVTFTGTDSGKPFIVGAVSFSGVDQTTSTSGWTTGDTVASINVSSATGDVVMSAVCDYKGTTPAVNGGETLIFANGNGVEAGATSYEAGATSVNMAWTLDGIGGESVMAGFNLIAGSSSVTVTPPAASLSYTGQVPTIDVSPAPRTVSATLHDSSGTRIPDGVRVHAFLASDFAAGTAMTSLGNSTTTSNNGSVSITVYTSSDVILVADMQSASVPAGEVVITDAITPVL